MVRPLLLGIDVSSTDKAVFLIWVSFGYSGTASVIPRIDLLYVLYFIISILLLSLYRLYRFVSDRSLFNGKILQPNYTLLQGKWHLLKKLHLISQYIYVTFYIHLQQQLVGYQNIAKINLLILPLV